MVVVAQLVRAPDCGSGGRRFETDLPPKSKAFQQWKAFFVLIIYFRQSELVSDSHKKRHEMMRFRNKFGMTFYENKKTFPVKERF